MPMRAFEMPADLNILIPLFETAFQYPEHEEWSLRNDELESLADDLRLMRRLWPLLRVMGLFVPMLRDLMRGYLWEENGKAVGLVNVSPKGRDARTWIIGNVAVLPEYRRRGIARKLVEATIKLARQKRAKTVMLEVIGKNLPAVQLYESLGFENYSGIVTMSYDPANELPSEPILPRGYTIEEDRRGNWQPRYELVKRITPPEVQRYDPVSEKRFRSPLLMRPLVYLILKLSGHTESYLVRHNDSGTTVVRARYRARKKEGGINEIDIRLDPEHSDLSDYLVSMLIRQTMERSPGRCTEVILPRWQESVITAALNFGFNQRSEGYEMGMALE